MKTNKIIDRTKQADRLLRYYKDKFKYKKMTLTHHEEIIALYIPKEYHSYRIYYYKDKNIFTVRLTNENEFLIENLYNILKIIKTILLDYDLDKTIYLISKLTSILVEFSVTKDILPTADSLIEQHLSNIINPYYLYMNDNKTYIMYKDSEGDRQILNIKINLNICKTIKDVRYFNKASSYGLHETMSRLMKYVN